MGERRIDDVICGHDNLRLIFHVGSPEIREPMPMIWILRALQKTRDDFSNHDVAIFKARRLLVRERFEKTRD